MITPSAPGSARRSVRGRGGGRRRRPPWCRSGAGSPPGRCSRNTRRLRLRGSTTAPRRRQPALPSRDCRKQPRPRARQTSPCTPAPYSHPGPGTRPGTRASRVRDPPKSRRLAGVGPGTPVRRPRMRGRRSDLPEIVAHVRQIPLRHGPEHLLGNPGARQHRLERPTDDQAGFIPQRRAETCATPQKRRSARVDAVGHPPVRDRQPEGKLKRRHPILLIDDDREPALHLDQPLADPGVGQQLSAQRPGSATNACVPPCVVDNEPEAALVQRGI